MDDLISREAAIEEIARRDTTDGTVKAYSGREINAILSDLPAVDAIPVEWIKNRLEAMLRGPASAESCFAVLLLLADWMKEQEANGT